MCVETTPQKTNSVAEIFWRTGENKERSFTVSGSNNKLTVLLGCAFSTLAERGGATLSDFEGFLNCIDYDLKIKKTDTVAAAKEAVSRDALLVIREGAYRCANTSMQGNYFSVVLGYVKAVRLLSERTGRPFHLIVEELRGFSETSTAVFRSEEH